MNILQVARRFATNDWGGTETVILETSKYLARKSHQVEILCTNATATCDEEAIGGIRVRRMPYFYPYLGLGEKARRTLDRKGGSPFSFALMRALEKYPALDLIHLHTGNRIGGIGRYVAQKRGIPYVVSLHGGGFDVPPEEARSWTEPSRGAIEWGKILGWWVGSRCVLKDAAAIICVGHKDRDLAQQHFPEKRVVHLPNGVDTARFALGDGARFRRQHKIPAEARVLLTVARIDSQKNQQFLIDNMHHLLKEEPNAHLVLIGHVTNESYYQRLLHSTKEKGLEACVTIIPGLEGCSTELVDGYHAADIFVLPSIHEPFGIVILEAWAAGLPVIASRVGGIPYFVEDRRDAMLCGVNDICSFLKAFRILIGNSDQMQNIAAAGQRKAREQYSWNQIVEQLTFLYDEVIRENPIRQWEVRLLRGSRAGHF